MLNISNALIFFCGGLALITGVAQLVVKQRSLQNYLLAAFLACIASFQIRVGFLLNGSMETHPGLSLFNISFTYAIGPLLYCYYKAVLKSWTKTSGIILPHLLIPVILIISELIIFASTPLEIRRYIIHNLFENKPDAIIISVRIVFTLTGLSIICYQTVVLKDLLNLYKLRELKGIHLSIFFMVAFSMICPVLFIIGFLRGNREFLQIGISMFCLLEIIMYFMAHRYPEFLDIIKKEIHKKRYEKTRLHDLDADAINNRLLELMEEDNLYADEDISLGRLSEHLKLTPHQLSEFLNRYRDVSFYTFITTYRIEEAKKLLLEDTDLTILQIAYSVGFNSKSAFNSAFLKLTGTTPQKFRKSKIS